MNKTKIMAVEHVRDGQIKTEVGECPRCGEEHIVMASKFEGDNVFVNGALFEYYATCPVFEEPFLISDISFELLAA